MTDFVIKVTSVRTSDFGEIKDFVKQIDFTLEGTIENQKFMLPVSKRFDDPTGDASQYTPFSQLTETQVTEWIASDEAFLAPYKSHINIVLGRMVEEAKLSQKPMPWAPPPEPPTPVESPLPTEPPQAPPGPVQP